MRFIHSLALLCTHTVSVRWWLYNHVGILRQDLSPNNVVYRIIKEMKEAKATYLRSYLLPCLPFTTLVSVVRVRLPWVIYSHPNSRESISTRGDIRR